MPTLSCWPVKQGFCLPIFHATSSLRQGRLPTWLPLFEVVHLRLPLTLVVIVITVGDIVIPSVLFNNSRSPSGWTLSTTTLVTNTSMSFIHPDQRWTLVCCCAKFWWWAPPTHVMYDCHAMFTLPACARACLFVPSCSCPYPLSPT